MTQSEETPFARYRQGYIDGYEGHPKRLPHDVHYVCGYEAGDEDDALGASNRYAEDLKPVSPMTALNVS